MNANTSSKINKKTHIVSSLPKFISIKGMEEFFEKCCFEVVTFGYNGNDMRMKIENI